MTQPNQPAKISEPVSEAISAMLNSDPFHSAMLMDMEIVEATELNDKPMPTACTDGFRKIWLNPDFIATMTPSQGAFVVAHEIQHKLLLYPMRVKDLMRSEPDFAPALMNVAQDFLINAQLDHAGYPVAQLSKEQGSYTVQEYIDAINAQVLGSKAGENHKGGFMFDPSVRTDQTTESIYNTLFKNIPDPPPEDQSGIAGSGNDVLMGEYDKTCKAEGLTQGQAKQQAQTEIVSAAQSAMARDPGSVPGNVKAMLESYAKPSNNWRAVLRQFMSGRARNDWSMRRPSRRTGATINGQTVLRHSMDSTCPDCIAIIVDTSGSVSDVELQQGLAEIQSISKRVKPQKTVVISIDTTVNAVDEYRAGQKISTLQTNGRGGTIMDPAFQYVIDKQLRPECIIVLTDGEFQEPDRKLARCPVLWGVCNPSNPDAGGHFTYGKVLKIETRDQDR